MAIKFRVDNVRLGFEHIFEASSFDDGQAAKYSAELIVDKDHPQAERILRAFFEAGKEKFPTDFVKAGVWPRGYSCSLKDADVDTDNSGTVLSEKYPAYKGCYILKTNSTNRPRIIDRQRKDVTKESGIIYSGCYVNAAVNISGYTFGKMTKGVKAYLNGVQFVKDGERFGSDALSDFDVLDGEDDDFFN